MRLLASLLIAALAACTPGSKAPKEKRATLIFVSDLWGQLEPCGCSADMKGGLDRMATRLAQARAEGPVLFVDAGDALFDQPSYRPDEEVQARIRARAVAEGLVAMGLDAKVFGARDRVLEGDWLPERLALRGPALREVGGIGVGLLPLGDGSQVTAQAQALRSEGADLVIALTRTRRSEARALALDGVDLVVGSRMETIPEGDQPIALGDAPPLLYPLGRGQGILQVEVVLRSEGQAFARPISLERRGEELAALEARIRSYEERLSALPEDADGAPFRAKIEELRGRARALERAPVELPAEGNQLAYRFASVTQDLAPEPKVRRILAAYDREVSEANLAYARENPRPCPEPVAGEATFVGQASCAACHPAAQAFWETTSHAKAYETLEAAHKQYDLSCVSCHVTGWDRPGGACRIDEVEARKDVGCESCHGPGSAHAAAPSKENIDRQVPAATCQSCHRPDHSLEFDYATYLSRILGPGHGEKKETP